MRSIVGVASLMAIVLSCSATVHAESQRAEAVIPVSVAVAPVTTKEIALSDRERSAIRGYYARQFAGGRCPIDLTRQKDGCTPPDDKKLWSLGVVLDSSVSPQPLPTELKLQLRTPPGYEFVRVRNDVLLIRPGERLVVDAVADLR